MNDAQLVLIGGLFTLFAGLLATLVNYYRERSEKQKWQRTLALEQRRIRFEEIKWALDLNSQREVTLYNVRLKTYPEIFSELEFLSSHNIAKLTEKQLLELADRLNSWAYSEAGLCMLSETRHTMFSLRDQLVSVANKEVSIDEIVSKEGIRTKLIELMRRDLNQRWSPYGDFKPLFEMDIEGVQHTVDDAEQKA